MISAELKNIFLYFFSGNNEITFVLLTVISGMFSIENLIIDTD